MPNPFLAFKDGNRIGGNDGEPPDTEMDIAKRLSAVETVIPTLATKANLDVGIAELRADLHKMDASIKTWMLGTVITIIGAMLAAIFGVAQMFKISAPSTPSAASAPIIINLPSMPTIGPPTPPPQK